MTLAIAHCRGPSAGVDASSSAADASVDESGAHRVGAAFGIAGGDLSGQYPSPTVTALQGKIVPPPAGTSTVLTYNTGNLTWTNPPSGGGDAGVIWSQDLAGSSSTQQFVGSISGTGGTGGTVPFAFTTANFTGSTAQLKVSNLLILQASTTNLAIAAPGTTGYVDIQNPTGVIWYMNQTGGEPALWSGSVGSLSSTNYALAANTSGTALNSPNGGSVTISAGTGNYIIAVGTNSAIGGLGLGQLFLAISGSGHTLTTTEALNPYIQLTGSMSTNYALSFPNVNGVFFVDVSSVTFGSFALSFLNVGGGGTACGNFTAGTQSSTKTLITVGVTSIPSIACGGGV